jgi:hypothetical protein
MPRREIGTPPIRRKRRAAAGGSCRRADSAKDSEQPGAHQVSSEAEAIKSVQLEQRPAIGVMRAGPQRH